MTQTQAQTATAEQKQWPKEFWDEFLRFRKQEEVNATIERCAQVAKDAANKQNSWMGCEPYARALLLEIYAAIRAMKGLTMIPDEDGPINESIQIVAAHKIRNWLRRNATAETNPEKKAGFVEAHNAALKIIEEAALTAPPAEVDATSYMRGYVDGSKETKAATIERCAQVVMDYLIKFQKEVDEDDQIAGRGVAIVLAELAAAIRALKDKP